MTNLIVRLNLNMLHENLYTMLIPNLGCGIKLFRPLLGGKPAAPAVSPDLVDTLPMLPEHGFNMAIPEDEIEIPSTQPDDGEENEEDEEGEEGEEDEGKVNDGEPEPQARYVGCYCNLMTY